MTEVLNTQILEEASAWFIEFRAGKLTGSAQEEFMRWLRRSPDHIRAYLDVSRLYVQLPGPDVLSASYLERLMDKARSRLAEDDGPTPLPVTNSQAARVFSRRAPWLPFAIAASVVMVVGAWWVITERGLYVTRAGESRTVALQDGSQIELNGRTRLRVSYSNDEREVALFEGQALFRVAKDKARPFVVDSGSARIRAVGTAFDVARQDTETTVTVLEGTVAVVPTSSAPVGAGAGGTNQLLVTAGEQAILTPEAVTKPRATNVSAATAWTRGQLEFDETPLSRVAEDFNRSSPRRLVLESSAVESVRISGIYSSVDPASLILFLRSQSDLEVNETADQIQVRSRSH